MTSKEELLRRIATIRRGIYGAFEIFPEEVGPVLCVHLRHDLAYVHYFPHADYLVHAGFRAVAAAPPRCPPVVRFLVFDARHEGVEPLEVARAAIVSQEEARAAAGAFFDAPRDLPASIPWEEL